MTTMPIEFKPPWVGVTPTERQQLEAELAQEVCLLHPLASLDREVSLAGQTLMTSWWPSTRTCANVLKCISLGLAKPK